MQQPPKFYKGGKLTPDTAEIPQAPDKKPKIPERGDAEISQAQSKGTIPTDYIKNTNSMRPYSTITPILIILFILYMIGGK